MMVLIWHISFLIQWIKTLSWLYLVVLNITVPAIVPRIVWAFPLFIDSKHFIFLLNSINFCFSVADWLHSVLVRLCE